ncbi:hypothetical protein [Stutzerimonas zhaodongensis]|jgi:cobaltochelatase CobN|uniref:Uncharacterized protein n=1 Tax=Stutzerimonas zhaodongensis TaxID=1176257 RepID=A0A365PR24_9GAMM|nr:hypothetical protein [Stutzerimonas zhaodongensis]QWV16070.1 hypothetical protein KQ248_16325 [Stutzerimonas zhaodongensis]RBA54443.1 hypothetical protein DQ403_17550 [Stutzerimonas zhaodongensis]
MSFAFRCVALALLLLTQVAPVSASQINAIISQYSAAEFASAAALLKQRFPERTVSARTPEQLAELDDAAIVQWLPVEGACSWWAYSGRKSTICNR